MLSRRSFIFEDKRSLISKCVSVLKQISNQIFIFYILDVITGVLLKRRATSLPGANISVKEGVAFVISIILGFCRSSGIELSLKLLIISIKAYTNLLRYGLKSCISFRILLVVNLLGFLLERRGAYKDEMNTVFTLVGFLNTGFKNGLSEPQMILEMKQSFDYDVTHEGVHYLGIQFNMINPRDVLFQLLASLNVPDTVQKNNDVIAVSDYVGQFIADHAIMLVIGLTLTCVAILMYIFRPRPKSPSEVLKDTAECTTAFESGEKPVSNVTSTVKYIVILFTPYHSLFKPLS